MRRICGRLLNFEDDDFAAGTSWGVLDAEFLRLEELAGVPQRLKIAAQAFPRCKRHPSRLKNARFSACRCANPAGCREIRYVR